ncbi:bifunctional transcriptional activator/DNA repair enzyme AdaA [Puia dinghuensis]|uniref:methylated-DNA--[protein]-cysteine S-methyltransferase n=1 Tax=Puia dinghuensis TaxID=1792502 RepID=A0A8J2UDI7_9BACT|nr:methylated-DNA--[protein]-cysteine S-methyltransferase [Puia dinghuensis]GGB02888.1 methylated-DNA--protein-cysteine methyltransferase [Puia dinghuensis]
METQASINYNRIAEAIAFYKANFKDQPSLEKVAEHVHLSPFHFQRMFKEWAGVTPKQFLQYLTLEHAKQVLESGATLSNAAFEAGLSGTGRLHDLFIKIEGMTPGEYKNGGEDLPINYRFTESPFGPLLIASTRKGVCYLAFADEGEAKALRSLQEFFPNAQYHAASDGWQEEALAIFAKDWSRPLEIKLHLKGTPFQMKVWETLLKVPMGGLTTYAEVADNIDSPQAVRAVGSAVGANPVAFLIPCHRVIRSDGQTGEYHWGGKRKQAIIGWEAAQVETKVA